MAINLKMLLMILINPSTRPSLSINVVALSLELSIIVVNFINLQPDNFFVCLNLQFIVVVVVVHYSINDFLLLFFITDI